ncbi:hypothetical protein GCM10027343_09740 [Noviherbaspirillum agri]
MSLTLSKDARATLKQLSRRLGLVAIVLQVVVLLVPTTPFYLAGMLILILGFFGANEGLTPAFLILAGLLLVPGFGLFALWWLVIRLRSIDIGEIPPRIWVGLTLGVGSALLFVSPTVSRRFKPPTPFTPQKDMIEKALIFGGGPLILVMSLLIVIWLRGRSRRNLLAGGSSD